MDFDYALLAKYLIDELSSEELEEVMEWRGLSPDNKAVFTELMKLRISSKYMQYNMPDAIEKALDVVNARINRTSRFRMLRVAMRYAAVILLLVSFSYTGWIYLQPEKFVTIFVKQGEDVKKIVLVDGSTVWLKAGSSLKIPETFAADNRKLSLQGEAFFDVAKNASPCKEKHSLTLQRMLNFHYMFQRIM